VRRAPGFRLLADGEHAAGSRGRLARSGALRGIVRDADGESASPAASAPALLVLPPPAPLATHLSALLAEFGDAALDQRLHAAVGLQVAVERTAISTRGTAANSS
jgi:hypothetical protein